ncbi:MAG: NfeD family protein [Burkholderiales bacterium]|jgi:membrane protein implicated in regulation of membrane protease activity
MQPVLAWLLAGLLLVVVELMTGTFYLLILGLAAGIGSVVAFFGQPFSMQALIAAISAIIGGILVHQYHRAANASSPKDSDNDIGEPVSIENWISEPGRRARVRYRGTTWDAEVIGTERIEADALLYVVARDGSRLKISTSRPSEHRYKHK